MKLPSIPKPVRRFLWGAVRDWVAGWVAAKIAGRSDGERVQAAMTGRRARSTWAPRTGWCRLRAR